MKLLHTLLCAAPLLGGGVFAAENDYYRLATLPIPEGIVLEAGALQWMPNGQLAVSTRLGDIYLIDGALEDDLSKVRFHRYAQGLHEVLGLTVKGDALYATQRGEITRIKDTDKDGRADLFETVSDFWSIGGDYHEYAFGSKMDPQGNIWVVLCLTGSFTSEFPFRGWCIRVNENGTAVPTVSGIRSPGGIGTNYLGDMFYTDNQGPWNGTSTLKELRPGHFVGHPSGNVWYKNAETMGERPPDPQSGSRMHLEADKNPKLLPTAVYFPYQKMGQSASGLINDGTQGKFGPFKNQLFVGDQTHSTVMRVFLEKVGGVYQGVCFPFRQGLASGSLSVEFAPNGALFVGGTDRGWGSRGGKPFALQRLNWTGKVPFEMHEMRAMPDGFELTFTQPVNVASAEKIESYKIETYTYIYQSSYGSPEVDRTRPAIQRAIVAPDRKSVRLVIEGLQRGHVHELHVPGLRSENGEPVLHPSAYYTLNKIPAS